MEAFCFLFRMMGEENFTSSVLPFLNKRIKELNKDLERYVSENDVTIDESNTINNCITCFEKKVLLDYYYDLSESLGAKYSLRPEIQKMRQAEN